jgi:hypothetical protein
MEFNNNATIHLTGNDELDLELLQIEISATYIDIFSSILGLIASRQAEALILQRAMQSQQNGQSQQQNNKKNTKNSETQTQEKGKQQQAQSNQQNQNTGQQQNTQHPTPSELATFASCLGVFTILIYTRTSIIRIYELYNNIQNGTSNFTLGPNINITVGFFFSAVGTLLRTIGAIQRVNEEAQITIVV